MKEYTLGFCFSLEGDKVVLIEKNKRSVGHHGLLNGVGGKVEEHEEPEGGMIREFQEETGVLINSWIPFARINYRGDIIEDVIIYCFFTKSNLFSTVKTMTDETVSVYNVKDLVNLKTVANIQWLIPMALDNTHFYSEIQTV